MKMTVIDVSRTVMCDLCNVEYFDSDEKGGFVFANKGVCPRCAPEFMKTILLFGEEKFIEAECPSGKTFSSFIVEFRGGNNTAKIMEW